MKRRNKARHGEMATHTPFARMPIERRNKIKKTGVEFSRKRYRSEERKKILADIGFWASKYKGGKKAGLGEKRLDAIKTLVHGLAEKFLALGGLVGRARARVNDAKEAT
jgi:hypothetical protein